jgi:hypothetical protein
MTLMLDLYFEAAWSLRNVLKMGISFIWPIKVFDVITMTSLSKHITGSSGWFFWSKLR